MGSPILVPSPFGIAFDSANGDLYVGYSNPGTVSEISDQTNTVIGNPIPAGRGTVGIALSDGITT